MIACACNSIVMGRHSSLGPIDPQFGGTAAHGVIEEFERAKREVKKDPLMANIWAPILSKYPATFVGECQKAIDWSEKMVAEWLETGMFANRNVPAAAAKDVIKELGDHALTLSHARHISAKRAKDIGLEIE